ncbi:uncharacterized protein LOC132362587 isoform X8 [Balaenoptera ricei]|uniref:uncharacterized protein LOC132362587 isoform X8 n=1 Tax=Balaenoptera ricei TaxID=2746895 RepID=UPI0028BD5D2E|nr:uncharacterized protein LOC132362587 isoform X8 [Balaenoptera ricei]
MSPERWPDVWPGTRWLRRQEEEEERRGRSSLPAAPPGTEEIKLTVWLQRAKRGPVGRTFQEAASPGELLAQEGPEDRPEPTYTLKKSPLTCRGKTTGQNTGTDPTSYSQTGDTGSSPGLGRSHVPQSDYAREPQLLSLRVWSLCSATGEAAIVRGPRTAMKGGPHLPQLEKALAQKRRPNTAINK